MIKLTKIEGLVADKVYAKLDKKQQEYIVTHIKKLLKGMNAKAKVTIEVDYK